MPEELMLDYLSTPAGIHRLMKGPYDDREIFYSVNDLMEYCKNGARYNGQKVAVVFPYHVQKYTIRNNIPLLELDNQEIIYKFDNNKDNEEVGWVLVYYYNGQHINNKNYFDDRNIHTYLDDPFAFMILDTVGIFKNSDSDYLEYLFERKNVNNNSITSFYCTDTVSAFEVGSSIKRDTASDTGIVIGADNNYHIMPLIKNTAYVDRLWVRADDYLYTSGAVK